MKQSRTPSGGTRSRCRRYASRRRRRARFRTTLPPSRRLTAKPTARGPGSRRQSSTNAGTSTRAPRRKSRSNSARDRSRSARGNPAGAAPGTASSLPAGVALWRAAASTPFGRPSSTCAPGTRGSWRAAVGSVGTSASRLPPRCVLGAQPAHPTDGLRTASSARPSGTPAARGCRPRDPVLWWAARRGDGRRVRAAAAPAPGRRLQCGRQSTAGLPELSTAVDKCVRNSLP